MTREQAEAVYAAEGWEPMPCHHDVRWYPDSESNHRFWADDDLFPKFLIPHFLYYNLKFPTWPNGDPGYPWFPDAAAASEAVVRCLMRLPWKGVE